MFICTASERSLKSWELKCVGGGGLDENDDLSQLQPMTVSKDISLKVKFSNCHLVYLFLRAHLLHCTHCL